MLSRRVLSNIACRRFAPVGRQCRNRCWSMTHPTKAKGHGGWMARGFPGATWKQFCLIFLPMPIWIYCFGAWWVQRLAVTFEDDSYEPDDEIYYMWQAFRHKSTRRLYERKKRYENKYTEVLAAITEAIGEDKIKAWSEDGERHIFFWGKDNTEPTEANAAIEAFLKEAKAEKPYAIDVPEATWVNQLLNANGVNATLLDKAFTNFGGLSSGDQDKVRKAAQAFAAVNLGLGKMRAEQSEAHTSLLNSIRADTEEWINTNSLAVNTRRRAVALSKNVTPQQIELATIASDLGIGPQFNNLADLRAAAGYADPVQLSAAFDKVARKERLSVDQRRNEWAQIVSAGSEGSSGISALYDQAKIAGGDVDSIVSAAAATELAAYKLTAKVDKFTQGLQQKKQELESLIGDLDVWVVESDFGLKKAEQPYQQKELLQYFLKSNGVAASDVLSNGTFDGYANYFGDVAWKTNWAATLKQLSDKFPTGKFNQPHKYDPLC